MSSVINTNVKALTAQGSLNAVNNKMSLAMQRLSTGMRINSAKDDAAGLAITNKMTADIRGLAVAIRNANDGLSLAQTAEGAMSSINGMLQRMRELAVQSANGTSSTLARKGSQLEIEQLKQEINNIAARTSFNGIKLLDGSASNLVLQTGSEFGQTMNLQLDSVNTSNLGVGSRPSLTSSPQGNYTDPALTDDMSQLQSGDLIINGVNIESSLAASDQLSFENKEMSAIAKAAAINAVSDTSRVKAVVNETYMAGTVMSAPGAAGTGDIEINGVLIEDVNVVADPGVSRTNVVLAINAVSAQTGVTAVDSGDNYNGIVLKAADGRNITVDLTGLTSAQTGLTEGTKSGSFSLQSIDGGPIVISSSSTGDVTRAGLAVGSYEANTSVMTTKAREASDAPPPVFGSGTLKINGVAISGADPASDKSSDTTAGSDSGVRSGSAIAIAASINKSTAETGVKAVVNENVVIGDDFDGTGDLSLVSFYLNGIDIDVSDFDGTVDYTAQDLADAINVYSGQTGVVVTDNGRGLTFTAADGRNISMATSLAGGFDALGLAAASTSIAASATAATAVTTYARISLVSDKQFTVTAGAEGSENFDALGFQQGTFGGESDGFKVSDVDISTQEGAAAALGAIDAALDSVNFSQSRLGALQNRLDSAISNLTEVSRNTSESRSRILDADYATETTNLAKAQIVQQAATAMLAQANQSAQSVLSLLK